ncbi:MAG: hypothetical protein H0W83_08760 [Planctomycetes bacterium]|nr:hypothetical protein [Planctomycetota bacterium]
MQQLRPLVVVAATIPDAPAGKRKPAKPRGRGRLTLPDHLKIVEERITVAPEERFDSDGTPLVPIGCERSWRLDWDPGHFIRQVTIRNAGGQERPGGVRRRLSPDRHRPDVQAMGA